MSGGSIGRRPMGKRGGSSRGRGPLAAVRPLHHSALLIVKPHAKIGGAVLRAESIWIPTLPISPLRSHKDPQTLYLLSRAILILLIYANSAAGRCVSEVGGGLSVGPLPSACSLLPTPHGRTSGAKIPRSQEAASLVERSRSRGLELVDSGIVLLRTLMRQTISSLNYAVGVIL